MKHLGNVLYITTPEAYLTLDGENVVVKKDENTSTRLPLHNLENIVCFTWQGASPALMGACADRNIGLCFLTPKFQRRSTRYGSYSPLRGRSCPLRSTSGTAALRRAQSHRDATQSALLPSVLRPHEVPVAQRSGGEGRLRERYNRFITVHLFTVTEGNVQMLNVEVNTIINRPIEEE